MAYEYQSLSIPTEAHKMLEEVSDKHGLAKSRAVIWLNQERLRLQEEVEYFKSLVMQLAQGQS
ncbi:MAG: hypothetical protein F6J87_14750 [Spirulina sp. SIO3F2]|nr:hypothetical protein [Spirulina sp. SIO3F2]